MGLNLADRQPLAIRAAVTGAVTAVVHVAVVLGAPLDKSAELAIGAAVDAVGLVVLLLWAAPAVTPNGKVVTRTTTDGAVVAGDAALVPTGQGVELLETAGAGLVVAQVPVDPGLVAGRHRADDTTTGVAT